jgi:hypothetical protein
MTVPPARARLAPTVRQRRAFLVCAVGVLTLGLASFAVVRSFAGAGQRWVAPMLLSSADPRVVQVAATLQEETARRNTLLLQKSELEVRLKEAERWIVLEEGFQASFKAALRSDLEGQRAELRRVQSLLAERDWSMETPSHNSDLDTKLALVRERIRLLEAAAAPGGRASSYGALTLRREYDRSLVASEQARELSLALTKAIADADEALRQKDALLSTIEASPYRRAIAGDVPLAFVPYDNAGQIRTGDELLACGAMGFGCRKVGTVGDILSTEVRGSGPGGDDLRGRLAVLSLTDARAVERPTLTARPSSR